MQIDIKATNDKFTQAVKSAVKSAKTQAQSRAIRASNELRNSALRVLRGHRTGKVYRLPYTTKGVYRASAPGEAPAVRSGALRISWAARAIGKSDGEIIASIHTDVKYAPWLQEGTDRIAPRPFEEPIIDDAKPRVMAIFGEPYLNK